MKGEVKRSTEREGERSEGGKAEWKDEIVEFLVCLVIMEVQKSEDILVYNVNECTPRYCNHVKYTKTADVSVK